MSHVDLVHLAFNMATLYQVGWLEQLYGSALYVALSFGLVISTIIAAMTVYHILIRFFGKVWRLCGVVGA